MSGLGNMGWSYAYKKITSLPKKDQKALLQVLDSLLKRTVANK